MRKKYLIKDLAKGVNSIVKDDLILVYDDVTLGAQNASLAQEISDRQAGDTTEATNRNNADVILQADINTKAPQSTTFTKTETTNFLASKADLVNGYVPSAQLPSFVDDVIEGYKSGAVFYNQVGLTTVITGEIGKIYVDLTTGQKSRQYRWSGSVYIQITNGLIASTDDVPEGNFLYFTLARVLATVLSGITLVTTGTIVSTDSVLIAFGKLQKQASDNATAISINGTAIGTKENSGNKQNSLVVDGIGVKFPTVDAVNAKNATQDALIDKIPSLNSIPRSGANTISGATDVVIAGKEGGIGDVYINPNYAGDVILGLGGGRTRVGGTTVAAKTKTFATNAAAITAGEPIGSLYHNGDGILRIVY